MPSGFTRNLRSLRKRSFLGQLVVTLLSLEMLFFASFISIPLPTPTQKNLQKYIQNSARDLINTACTLNPAMKPVLEENLPFLKDEAQQVRTGSYVPLIPVAVALGYVLGSPLALLVTAIYLLVGLLAPQDGIYLFASGGGTSYVYEPGFGYVIGIICGAWFAAFISPDEERKSWRQLVASTAGVLIAHLIGLGTVFGSSIAVLLFEGEQAYLRYQPWLSEQIRNLSWYSMPYDLLFATMMIALLFPLRILFTMLMSPDISNKQRPKVESQLEVLQETVV